MQWRHCREFFLVANILIGVDKYLGSNSWNSLEKNCQFVIDTTMEDLEKRKFFKFFIYFVFVTGHDLVLFFFSSLRENKYIKKIMMKNIVT